MMVGQLHRLLQWDPAAPGLRREPRSKAVATEVTLEPSATGPRLDDVVHCLGRQRPCAELAVA